jgi:hypothetical protein
VVCGGVEKVHVMLLTWRCRFGGACSKEIGEWSRRFTGVNLPPSLPGMLDASLSSLVIMGLVAVLLQGMLVLKASWVAGLSCNERAHAPVLTPLHTGCADRKDS